VDSRSTTSTKDAIAALTAAGLPLFHRTIRNLKAFEKAALDGVPVYAVKGDKMAGSGWREYQELGAEILEAVGDGR
jgi:chromosome partitioning protein